MQQNGYPTNLITDTISRFQLQTAAQKITEGQAQTDTFLTIPYVKGISEKIRRIASSFGIKTAFKSSNTLKSMLTKTKPKQGDDKECIYQVLCECGESYIGETKRPLAVRLKEHRLSTQRGETARSGIADHVWSNQHRIKWSEAKVLHKETHWRKRKFLEAAFIEQNQGIFSNPSVEIPNIWKPLLERNRLLKLE